MSSTEEDMADEMIDEKVRQENKLLSQQSKT